MKAHELERGSVISINNQHQKVIHKVEVGEYVVIKLSDGGVYQWRRSLEIPTVHEHGVIRVN